MMQHTASVITLSGYCAEARDICVWDERKVAGNVNTTKSDSVDVLD